MGRQQAGFVTIIHQTEPISSLVHSKAAGQIPAAFSIKLCILFTMCKHKGNRAILVLIIIIAIGASGLLIWKVSERNNDSQMPPVSQNINWITYNNVAHGYKISYPQEIIVAPVAEMDSRPIDKIDDIEFFIPGKITALFITVLVPYTNASKTIATERTKLINLPLQQYAETLRQYQIEDKNPTIQNKQVGDLKEAVIAGQKAYSFTLTKSFTFGSVGGYALADSTIYNYILTENKNGEKLIIHYPMGNSLSEQMKNSFAFTDSSPNMRIIN